MTSKWVKRGIGLVALALVIVAAVYALSPQPVPVDLATVEQGSLTVTINEEGMARIKDVFVVSAPIDGRVQRLPVEVGDTVHRNTTTVATIHPADPPFLDIRSRRELEAAVRAAHAAVTLAKARLAAAKASERLMEADLERAQRLASAETIPTRALDRAVAGLDTARAQVAEAIAALNLRENELVSAEARLIEPDQLESASRDACCLTLRAPVSGTVLKVLTESEQVIRAGQGLLEIGDPDDMEIIVHLLSSDAVNVEPGGSATIDQWGGEPLSAEVRRVDPAAYTKVSALGIEEQRVDAILDVVGPPEAWKRLGHAFQVMAHITTWQGDDVVSVPLGALFRTGSDWTVFRVADGIAVATIVELGHRNSRRAEIIEGLGPGDVVVMHPSDRVTDGGSVVDRRLSEG